MEDKELKREFELERVILFSDAVFAIIITIMILDVKLPENLRHATGDEVTHRFKDLVPKFAAYLFSFFLVSVFWMRHLRIFKVLKDYNMPLVVRNLMFLFIISLFPFAITTVTGALSLSVTWSIDIYLGIILLAIFMQTVIIHYIVKHKHTLCFYPHQVEETLKWKVYRLNYLLVPLALAAVAVLNVLNVYPPLVVYVMAFYAIIMRLYNKRVYGGR